MNFFCEPTWHTGGVYKWTFKDKKLIDQYWERREKMLFQLIFLLSSFISIEGADYCEGIDYKLLDDPTRNENQGKSIHANIKKILK